MTTIYFIYSKVEICSHAGVRQPHENQDGAFYKIYSAESFILRPREDIYLDLKIKINAPLEEWINLLPSLKERGLKIEEYNYSTNTLKGNSIQIHILNRHFTKTTHIKKIKNCLFIFTRRKS